MAVMDAINRARAAAQFMRDNEDPTPFTKADLRAAVDATDTWIDANQAAWLAALPAAFRNNSTAAQKTNLFMYVVRRRANDLRAEED